ncbi:MAG: metallophosphoesterase [Candidatus Gracilibacteria bacterium]|jgi:Icc-related predicted phosphoesterase
MAKHGGLQIIRDHQSIRGSGSDAEYCAGYDSVFEDGQENPKGPLVFKYGEYARQEGLGPCIAPSSIEALMLADINLKTRGLIGVVLGSLAKYLLFQPPSIKSLQGHMDLDVLVLNPHSNKDPGKNEWGVDWWVRPQGMAPTNGRVSLWYDIGLKNGVEVENNVDDSDMESPFFLDEDRIIYTPIEQKDSILKPGLHLLDEDMLKKVISFCNGKAKEISKEGLELTEKLKHTLTLMRIHGGKGIVFYGNLLDVGDLIISSIRRFQAKYQTPNTHLRFEQYQYVKEVHLKEYGYDELFRYLNEEVEAFAQSLMTMPINYRYLIKHSVRQKKRPVFPVIHSEALDFRGMDNSFNDKFRERFAFGTDFHGNLRNIDQFLAIAKERNVDHVIFGGDVAPKRMAVKFSDGKAVCIDDPDNLKLWESDDLYENGFMLFEEDIDANSFLKLIPIFKKLAGRRESKMETKGNLELDEILLLEKHKKHIVDFLKSDAGKKLLESYLRESSKMPYGQVDSDPEGFTDALIDFLKNEYLFSKNLLNSEIGKNMFTEGERKRFSDNFFKLKAVDIDGMFAHIGNYGTLFAKWEGINQKLNLHSTEQRKVFFDDFMRRIREFKKDFKGTISIILGNDDPTEYIEYLKEVQREGLLFDCTNRIVTLSKDIEVIGYSNVPPMSEVAYDDWFKDEDDIDEDLNTLGAKKSRKFLIANIHCPPCDTKLSKAVMRGQMTDLGSLAVLSFIREFKPDVVLCGHTHESWRISGVVREKIGNTMVFNPGASEKNCRILIGSLEKPEKFELEVDAIDPVIRMG